MALFKSADSCIFLCSVLQQISEDYIEFVAFVAFVASFVSADSSMFVCAAVLVFAAVFVGGFQTKKKVN